MRNLTLKHLRIVASIASTGKIVSAAKQLNVTPPAVTLQLQQIESSIGLPLFERGRRGLRLTAAGDLLYDCARAVENQIRATTQAVEELRGLRGGRVAVGVVSTAKYFAPSVLGAFKQAYPDIELQLIESNRADLLRSLASLDVDLAIMGQPPDDIPVESEILGDHPLTIIAPPRHRLVRKRRIPSGQLSEETLLVREQGSGTRLAMDRFFSENQGPPRRTMVIASNETIKQAVMVGLGIAVISTHTIAAEVADGRLAVLDVVGMPMMRKWFLVRHAKKRQMPSSLALWNFFLNEGRSYLPANVLPARLKTPSRKK